MFANLWKTIMREFRKAGLAAAVKAKAESARLAREQIIRLGIKALRAGVVPECEIAKLLIEYPEIVERMKLPA